MHSLSRLLLAIDTSNEPARRVAERFGAAWSTQWKIAVDDDRIDVVIVSLPERLRSEVAVAALRAGKHVLVELPIGAGEDDAGAFASASNGASGLAKAGVPLRYHPGIARARSIVEDGTIGTPVALRVRYLHGGDRGERTLADRVTHATDLVHWFAGVPDHVFAGAGDEDAFALLGYGGGRAATIHVSCAPWKDSFLFEAIGKRGSIAVEGLGAAFGVETLVATKRDESGHVEEFARETYGGPDVSFALEWDEFVRAIHDGRPYHGKAEDALQAARVVTAMHESSIAHLPSTIEFP